MIKVGHIHALLLSWLGLLTIVAFFMPGWSLHLTVLSGALALAVGAFLFPGAALILGIISTGLSVENFLFFENFNLNNQSFLGSSSFHKVITLALMAPAIARYGIKPKPNPVILAIVFMFLATFVASTRLPSLDNAQIFQTLVGLAMPYLVFNMCVQPRWVESHLAILAFFPLFSVALGYVCELAGVLDGLGRPWTNFKYEAMTGAYRLSGINIPAGLAAHSFVAFFISIYQAVLYGRKKYYFLAGVMLLLTVLSGTRVPAATEIMFAGLGIMLASGRDLRASAKVNFAIIGTVMLAVILAIYWPNLEARFTGGGQSAEVINTSSRATIWELEYDAWQENPMFGRGLGAGAIFLLDNEYGNLRDARATHNEYLRLLLDGGIAGLAAYLFGMITLIVSECRGINLTAGRLTFALFLSFSFYSLTDNTITSGTTMNLFYAIALLLIQARMAAAKEAAQSGAPWAMARS